MNYKVKVIIIIYPSFSLLSFPLSHSLFQSFPSPWMVFQEKVQMQQKDNKMAKQQVGVWKENKTGKRIFFSLLFIYYFYFLFFSFAFVIHLWSQAQLWLFSVEKKCLPFRSLNNLIKQGFVLIVLDLFRFLLRFEFIFLGLFIY